MRNTIVIFSEDEPDAPDTHVLRWSDSWLRPETSATTSLESVPIAARIIAGIRESWQRLRACLE